MILHHPETDIKLNIIYLVYDIAKILKGNNNYILIENIMDEFLKSDKRRTPELFLDSIIFLYSFGIIEKKGYKIKLSNNGWQEKISGVDNYA